MDYYNNVIGITFHYKVVKSDTKIVKIMAKKTRNPTYTDKIFQHFSRSNINFEEQCTEIANIQQLIKGPEDAP